jgi:O-antigen/teichoic acid export membrane protein
MMRLAWGAAKYGDWLTLSAIPSYLTLTNMGFGDASGSDMTARVARGDRAGALCIFQSCWALLNIISLFVLLAAAALAYLVPWKAFLHLSSLSTSNAVIILLVLAAYVVVDQQNGILESGFRCDGHFATGTLTASILRLGEAAIACAVGVTTGNLVWVAFTYLLVRTIGTLAYAALLYKRVPWLRLGLKNANVNSIKGLMIPALGFMAIPAAHALTFQGFTILVGAVAGPVAVAAFSTLRTLTRCTSQMLTMLANALWPELSRAFGCGDIPLARSLHRGAYQAALAISIGTSAALWIIGPMLYHLWIGKSLLFDSSCFHILLLVAVANSLWSTSSVVAMSTNQHHRLALAYLCSSAASIAIGYVLCLRFGTTGAAVALFMSDAFMSVLVLRESLSQLRDTMRGFLGAVLRFSPATRVGPGLERA